MKICIVEPYYHASYFHAMLRIAEECGYDVSGYTVANVWDETRHFFPSAPNYSLTIFNNIKDLFSATIAKSSDFDCVVFNTLQVLEWQNLMKLAIGKWKCPVVMTMHNPKYWFEHRGYPLWRVRARARLFFRNQILKKYDGLIFLSEYMETYSREKGYGKPVAVLPYGIYEDSYTTEEPTGNDVIFGVPGTISEHRDYDLLFEVFDSVWRKHGKRIHLWLLGSKRRAFGDKIASRCVSLSQQGYDVRFFQDTYVSEKTLQDTLSPVDYVILPLSEQIFPNGLKVSGTLYDAVRYRKPFILPSSYLVPSHIKGGHLSYKSAGELEDVIELCIAGPETLKDQLRSEAYKNAEECLPGSWRAAFQRFIEEVVVNSRR